MTAAGVLFWAGVALELVGIALVSAADWVPYAKDFGRGTWRALVAAWWRIARIFGRRRTITAKVGRGDAIALGDRVTGIVSPGENATLEEHVAFLLRQSEQTQRALSELGSRVGELPDEWRRDLAVAREELEQQIERRLTETQETYLHARRLGVVCLVAGVALLSASNLA